MGFKAKWPRKNYGIEDLLREFLIQDSLNNGISWDEMQNPQH